MILACVEVAEEIMSLSRLLNKREVSIGVLGVGVAATQEDQIVFLIEGEVNNRSGTRDDYEDRKN